MASMTQCIRNRFHPSIARLVQAIRATAMSATAMVVAMSPQVMAVNDEEPITSVLLTSHLEAGTSAYGASLLRWTFTPDHSSRPAGSFGAIAECCIYHLQVDGDDPQQRYLTQTPLICWSVRGDQSPTHPRSARPPAVQSIDLTSREVHLQAGYLSGDAPLQLAAGTARWQLTAKGLIPQSVLPSPGDACGALLNQLGGYDLIWPLPNRLLFRGHNTGLPMDGISVLWSGMQPQAPELWYGYSVHLRRLCPLPFVATILGLPLDATLAIEATGQGRTELQEDTTTSIPTSAKSHLLVMVHITSPAAQGVPAALSGSLDISRTSWILACPSQIPPEGVIPAVLTALARDRQRLQLYAAAADSQLAAIGRGMLYACDHPPVVTRTAGVPASR